jgi:hypothetical protein
LIRDYVIALVLVVFAVALAVLSRGGFWLLEAALLGSLTIYVMTETIKKMGHGLVEPSPQAKEIVQSRIMHYAFLINRPRQRRSSVLAKNAFEKALMDKLGESEDLNAVLDELVKTVETDDH